MTDHKELEKRAEELIDAWLSEHISTTRVSKIARDNIVGRLSKALKETAEKAEREGFEKGVKKSATIGHRLCCGKHEYYDCDEGCKTEYEILKLLDPKQGE